jgi:hypothetical protein
MVAGTTNRRSSLAEPTVKPLPARGDQSLSQIEAKLEAHEEQKW